MFESLIEHFAKLSIKYINIVNLHFSNSFHLIFFTIIKHNNLNFKMFT
jgi:hypothetical protein